MRIHLKPRLKRFTSEESGSMIAEAVIILPLLLWAYLAMFIYWDAYRSETTAVKASYTLADMVSRNDEVDTAYLSGLHDVFDYLMNNSVETAMVVSSIVWDKTDNRYEVLWSEAYGEGMLALNTTRVAQVADRLPIMSDGDSVILVQSRIEYVPSIDVGVPDFFYRQFIATRPRLSAGKIECTDCRVGGLADDSNGVIDVQTDDIDAW